MKSRHSKHPASWLLILTFLIGIIILTVALTESPAIKHLGKKEYDDITADKIAKAAKVERQNRSQSDDFNYAKTGQLNPVAVANYQAQDVIKSFSSNKDTSGYKGGSSNYYPAGRLMIPAVGLYLPIGIGVSNAVLVRGAGTLKPDQKMGEGNYALAGHYMTNTRILFSPIKRVQKGNRIIITDMKKVYTYQAISNQIVDKDDVEVLDDQPGRKLITLITCASWRWNEPDRIVVQGKLQSVQSYK
ncbi:sortase A [Lentilactobacillus senioris DSM 24302 = JCM 17472]|uniref:Sortase A n=1 Tax=Lentilactobacillus senioris DSM 24302 = JCM 17472 TaxID=1423802 RepID=A0A0R2CWV9_9LACO|nr:class A sortase [Lentilactobacillus senioris]KRM94244.1 sortase A [Lentilactobacillus senioris DSM 24302 = JCM 17472]